MAAREPLRRHGARLPVSSRAVRQRGERPGPGQDQGSLGRRRLPGLIQISELCPPLRLQNAEASGIAARERIVAASQPRSAAAPKPRTIPYRDRHQSTPTAHRETAPDPRSRCPQQAGNAGTDHRSGTLEDGFNPTVTTRNRDPRYASTSPKNRIGTAGVTADPRAAARPYERHAPPRPHRAPTSSSRQPCPTRHPSPARVTGTSGGVPCGPAGRPAVGAPPRYGP